MLFDLADDFTDFFSNIFVVLNIFKINYFLFYLDKLLQTIQYEKYHSLFN